MSDKTAENEKGLPKAVLVIVVLAVIAAVVFIVLGQRQKFEPVNAGMDAIDFTLPDLAGKPVSLKDYRGKVVFLNFWATWCKPCEEEMPSMEALYQGLKDQPFEILAVSVDKDGPETVAAYAKKYNLSFKVLHDRKGAIKETYKTTGVPETFIIDQNGVIAEKVWGPRDWSRRYSYEMIADLLSNGPKPRDSYKTKAK
ncbi:MAG: TlpA family protein disulfide reductase [Deltaproteobacteria bacterium]|nr:TlpA family protein disulfide reductase [Deltaproteobacteria bacterium]